MALGIYEEEDIRGIAKSIRNNLGNDTKYTVGQMPSAINEIQTYAYNSGYSEGKTEGLEEGKAIGYTEGKTDGIVEGKKSQYDEFWDSVINDNTMKNVQNLFAGFGWNDTTFYPPKDIIVISGRGDGMFARNIITNIKQRLIDCGVKLDLSRCNNLYQSFLYSTTRELPEISTLNNTTFQQTFSACSKLETIDKLILKSDGSQTWVNAFNQSPAIKNIVIEGVIGQNGFNVQWCPLTHESLMSIINALKDNSGTDTWNTITLGADNIAKLTQEELDIMEQKHWEYT